MTRLAAPAGLLDSAGRTLGTSNWLLIDHKRINDFADTTIHHS